MDFAVALGAISIRPTCVRQHHSLPPVIALCLSLPPDIWLGSWALYLTDSMGRDQPMHALAWVNAFYGRSRDPQIWKTRALGVNICRPMKLVSQPSPQLYP